MSQFRVFGTSRRFGGLALLTVIMAAGAGFPLVGQASQASQGQPSTLPSELRARRPAQAPLAEAPPRGQGPSSIDAQATRNDLMEILRKHPPAVARVLKLDPSLMRNEDYLAPYHAIRDFLAGHPDIYQNAGYYLEQVHVSDFDGPPPNPRVDLLQTTLAGLAFLIAFVVVLSTLVWLVRTILDQRRWSRLSKIQAEVHSKLMDRFSSNDELLTYVQTPSGKRFLESGPSPLEEGSPAVGAPFARILWSVQIGVVMLVAGLGLLYVSGNTLEEAREFFFISGCLALALGAGFTISAAAAYVLSWKLGLLDRPAGHHA
jgi:hypothetical protein